MATVGVPHRERKVKQISKKLLLLLPAALLVALSLSACGGSASEAESPQSAVSIGPVKINPHPTSLEGKTVVLRWNSKPKGDKYLTRTGELLAQQVKVIKAVKLREMDPSTAEVSSSLNDGTAVADKVAALKPDLVIAAQAD